MKNKKLLLTVVIVILIVSILGLVIYTIYGSKNNGVKVDSGIKPPLKIDVFKEDEKVGKAIGVISSWKNNDSVSTSSLVSANIILEKEKSIENVKAGDMVKLSTEEFDKSLLESIYDITYNAISDEDYENQILPIDEIIEFSNNEIQIPILRENLDKTLYYHVNVNFKDKGTVVYFFKVDP